MFSRVFFLILLANTLLFSSVNIVQKALIIKGELNLFFINKFSSRNVRHFTLSNPHREIYDFKNTQLAHVRVPLGLGKYIRMAQYQKDVVRVVVIPQNNIYKPLGYQPFFSSKKYNISLPELIDIKPNSYIVKSKQIPKKAKKVYFKRVVEKHHYSYNHKNDVIVIDPGHGGHDSGAVGGRKYEKTLVLQVAKRVARYLRNLGYPVYMTRRDDRFLKLSQRTHIADRKKAVVFISIHANSVPKRKRNIAHGIETFFLQNTRDAKSQRVAVRENRAVLRGTTRLSRNVIIDSVLTGPKIVESNKLAIDVQRHMIYELKKKYSWVKDSGVRHAPFWVLVGASRPSILVELGYISNPRERKRLFTPTYQALQAKGIAYGIDSYLSNRKKEIDIQ